MARIFGGKASRAEAYGLFIAAVIVLGGGIGGAVVLTHDGSSDSQSAQTSVRDQGSETTSTAASPAAPEDGGTSSPNESAGSAVGARSSAATSPDSPSSAPAAPTLPSCSNGGQGCGGEPPTTTTTTRPCVLPQRVNDPFISSDLGEVIQHIREVWWIPSCGEMRWDTLQCHDPTMPINSWRFLGFQTINEGYVKQRIARNLDSTAPGAPGNCTF